MTDTSELPADTPDIDRAHDLAKMTVTPATANRTLFGRAEPPLRSRTPGRGEVPRGHMATLRRDKVRKRKRQAGDRDIGSVRSRLPHDSADSDSDWEGAGTGGRQPRGSRSQAPPRAAARPGFLSRLFTTIHEHPSVPLILSWWVQLAINVFIVSLCMWGIWSFIAMMRADLAGATEAARSRLLAEMEACAHEYTKNKCAPKSARLPALGLVCDEWELCMNQDPAHVMKVQVSAKNVAEIINEFVGVMNIKAWVSVALRLPTICAAGCC